jgi:flagellar assembly protein FliH
MSSSGAGVISLPVLALEYLDMGSNGVQGEAMPMALFQAAPAVPNRPAEFEFSAEELAARLDHERAKASHEAERRLQQGYEDKLLLIQGSVTKALEGFELQRSDYFAKVEAETVQLALSIAAKILHREAQVDPMLVAGLVRITLESMREGTIVTVRVSPGRMIAWQDYFTGYPKLATIQVVEDPELTELDCVLETDLGSTHVGLDRQLKEVEQGFFDLLALRPEGR